MSILIAIKNVYGRELIYPACETSKLLAELTGKKTLTRVDLAIIQRLGFKVEVKPVLFNG